MKEEASLPLHKSVLVDEVIQYLDPKPGKVYLDVTFGTGGHTRAILEHEVDCSVIALDWDERVLELYGEPLKEQYGKRLNLVWGNFALLYKILKKAGIEKVDGIIADFGTSQIQITERPGFSVYRDTPLDMRMSPPHQKITAAELLNKSSEEKLQEIFFDFGQERYAKQIARAIIQHRQQEKFRTTAQLARLVERVVPYDKKVKIHPATRVFQALRIYVNKELHNITAFLSEAVRVVSSGGSIVCISFHSLEDRLVKQFFLQEERKGVVTVITKGVITPSETELARNPSSRSSKLRAAKVV